MMIFVGRVLGLLGLVLMMLMTASGAKADDVEKLWNKYNDAIIHKNCVPALKYLKEAEKVTPLRAYQIWGILHHEGRCVEKDEIKSIAFFQKVPKNELSIFYALKLKRMLFERAESKKEKKRIVDELRDILLLSYSSTFDHAFLTEYAQEKFDEHPEFQRRLLNEIVFFKEVENDTALKMMQVKQFIKSEKYLNLAKSWLIDLKIMDNAEAQYLFGQHFENDPSSKRYYTRNAAWGGFIPAQLERAKYYAKSDERGDHRIAYYWFANLKKKAVDVEQDLQNLMRRMNPEDIAIVDLELDNEDSVFR